MHLAAVVVIDADAQIDLIRVFVCVKCLGDAKNRVTRGHFNGGEQRGGKGCVHRDNIKNWLQKSLFCSRVVGSAGAKKTGVHMQLAILPKVLSRWLNYPKLIALLTHQKSSHSPIHRTSCTSRSRP